MILKTWFDKNKLIFKYILVNFFKTTETGSQFLVEICQKKKNSF